MCSTGFFANPRNCDTSPTCHTVRDKVTKSIVFSVLSISNVVGIRERNIVLVYLPKKQPRFHIRLQDALIKQNKKLKLLHFNSYLLAKC